MLPIINMGIAAFVMELGTDIFYQKKRKKNIKTLKGIVS
jgi:hypothetical protein